MLNLTFLGQVGFSFEWGGGRFLVDPYLSNSVEEKEAPDIKRQVPILYNPNELSDVDAVFITHSHRDHCDIDTLMPLSKASGQCIFFGPPSVITHLRAEGVDRSRLYEVAYSSFRLKDIKVTPLPSAHPEVVRLKRGGWEAMGYIFEIHGIRIYHPGDTAVSSEVIDAVKAFGDVDLALLPVNEINYYKNLKGIIGNMSVREAFRFAEDIGVKLFIPTHWDMFKVNQVYREEIELLYRKISPPFEMRLMGVGEELCL